MTIVPPNGPGVRNLQSQGGAQFQLNLVMLQWKNVVVDYERQSEIVGQAEGDYRLGKASFIRDSMARDPKMSVAKAQALAEADEEVGASILEYKIESARLDAMQKKLKWLEAEVGRLRSLVTDEREERKLDTYHQPG